jgi:hypothetical protein
VKAWQVPLGGYGDRRAKPATEVQDAVYARALVLAEGKTKAALVSVDLCFVPANVKREALKHLKGVGISAERLLIAATHTHSAPDPLAMHSGNTLVKAGWTSFDKRLLDFTAKRIADAVLAAEKRLVPARVGSAAAAFPGLNRNRRGEKVTDEAMTALRVITKEGRPLAAMVNFAAHPTLDDRAFHISADWPGVLCTQIERAMGEEAICLFFNGAEGDASPGNAEGATAKDKINDYGTKLAHKALELLSRVETQAEANLKAWTQAVTLPPRKPNALFFVAAADFGASIAEARTLVTRLMPEKTELGFVRVGDLLLIGMPCEPTGELGLAAKAAARKAGYAHPAVVALANDWLGYALTPEQYRAGNYEAAMSFYGEPLGPTLLSALKKGVQASAEQKNPRRKRIHTKKSQ